MIISQISEKCPSLAHAIVHPRRFSDDARRSRQSRCILRACCTWRAYGVQERQCRPNPTSVLRSRLTLLGARASFGAPVQSWFQSSRWCQSRSVRRSAFISRSHPFARESFTLVHRARARDSPRCFRKTMLVLARSWMMCRRACWKRPGEMSSRDDRCTSRFE